MINFSLSKELHLAHWAENGKVCCTCPQFLLCSKIRKLFNPHFLAVAHPGIQVGVGQVDQEIDEHHGRCDKQVNARDDGVFSL